MGDYLPITAVFLSVEGLCYVRPCAVIVFHIINAFDFLGLVYAPKKRKQQRNNVPADIGRISFREISCT